MSTEYRQQAQTSGCRILWSQPRTESSRLRWVRVVVAVTISVPSVFIRGKSRQAVPVICLHLVAAEDRRSEAAPGPLWQGPSLCPLVERKKTKAKKGSNATGRRKNSGLEVQV